MIPFVYENTESDFENSLQPSKTYGLHLEEKRIWGMLEGSEAIRQAIYKILNTERYESTIYSWNYGSELVELVGQPVPDVYSQLEGRITEALLRDDRITAVVDFSFSNEKGRVTAAFTAVTTEGSIAVEKEVGL